MCGGGGQRRRRRAGAVGWQESEGGGEAKIVGHGRQYLACVRRVGRRRGHVAVGWGVRGGGSTQNGRDSWARERGGVRWSASGDDCAVGRCGRQVGRCGRQVGRGSQLGERMGATHLHRHGIGRRRPAVRSHREHWRRSVVGGGRRLHGRHVWSVRSVRSVRIARVAWRRAHRGRAAPIPAAQTLGECGLCCSRCTCVVVEWFWSWMVSHARGHGQYASNMQARGAVTWVAWAARTIQARQSCGAGPRGVAQVAHSPRGAAWSRHSAARSCCLRRCWRSGCASLCLGTATCPACCRGSARRHRHPRTPQIPRVYRCGRAACGMSQTRQSHGSGAPEPDPSGPRAAPEGRGTSTAGCWAPSVAAPRNSCCHALLSVFSPPPRK